MIMTNISIILPGIYFHIRFWVVIATLNIEMIDTVTRSISGEPWKEMNK